VVTKTRLAGDWDAGSSESFSPRESPRMDVQQTIKGILAAEINVDVALHRMTSEDGLRDIYGLDSIGFVELRVQCEDAFGITITDDEFAPENFATLGSITALVESKLQAIPAT
jgi:acyl carrier protein